MENKRDDFKKPMDDSLSQPGPAYSAEQWQAETQALNMKRTSNSITNNQRDAYYAYTPSQRSINEGIDTQRSLLNAMIDENDTEDE